MHPSTGMLIAKGFEPESHREFPGKAIPFSYVEHGGETHAVSGNGDCWKKSGSVWPGPEFEEVSSESQLTAIM